MGHESPIEPWLAPDNRAACGLRTDWLRRAQVMKTAGRENQTRCLNEAASRDHGTEGHSNPAPWGGLEGKKTSGRRRSVFFLTPFIELIGHELRIVIKEFVTSSVQGTSLSRLRTPALPSTSRFGHRIRSFIWAEITKGVFTRE